MPVSYAYAKQQKQTIQLPQDQAPQPAPGAQAAPQAPPSFDLQGPEYWYEPRFWRNQTLSYWENPQRLVRYRQVLKSMRDAGGAMPEWYNQDVFDQAYDALDRQNRGTGWWNWDPLPYDDPLNQALTQQPAPPKSLLWPKEQKYAENSYVPAEPEALAQPGQEAMTEEQWAETPLWKRMMLGIMSSPLTMAAMTALPGAAAGAAIGGPVGAVVGGAVGAGLGAYSTYNPGGSVAKLLMNLDYPREWLEQAFGIGVQAYGSLKDPDMYGAIDQVLLNLPEARKAATLYYTSGGVFHELLNLPAMAEPGLRAAVLAAAALAAKMGKPELALEWAKSLPTSPMQLATRTQYYPMEGYKAPEEAPFSGDVLALLANARERMIAGEDPDQVINEYTQAYGLSGQFRELVSGFFLDPLNYTHLITQPAGSSIARRAGNINLANAFQNSHGLTETVRLYGKLLRTEEMTAVAKMDGFSRWLGMVTKEGGSAALAQSKGGVLGWLFSLRPQDRASETTNLGAVNLAAMLERTGDDPANMVRNITLLGRTPDTVARELSMRSLGSSDAAALPLALRGFDDTANAMLTLYTATRKQAGAIEGMAALLEVEPAEILTRLKTPESAEVLLRAVAEKARQAGERGAGIVAAYDAGRNPTGSRLPPSEHLTAANVRKWYSLFVEDGVPFDASMFKGQLFAAAGEHISKWSAEWFNVKPDPGWVRLSQTVKSAQSAFLLGLNPTYLVNNFLNNIVTMSVEGVLGLRTPAEINKFWNDFGILPPRLHAGIGPEALGTEIDYRAIRKAATQPGFLSDINQFMNTKVRKVEIFANLAVVNERWSSAQAFTAGTKSAWGKLWRRNVGYASMPAHLERALSDINPNLPGLVYGAINGSMNKAGIEKVLFDGFARVTIDSVLPELSRAMNKTEGDIAELLHQSGIYDELTTRLQAAETNDDVHRAIAAVNQLANDRMLTRMQAEIEHSVAQTAARIKVEGAQAVVDIYDQNQVRLLNTIWTVRKLWDDAWIMADQIKEMGGSARAIFDKAEGEINNLWNIHQARNAATYIGMVQGLGVDNASSRAMLNLVGQFDDNWSAYRLADQELKRVFYATDYPDKTARTLAWDTLETERNELYAKHSGQELNLQRQLDEQLSVLMDGEQPGAGEPTRRWRRAVMDIREKAVLEIQAHTDSLRGQPGEVRRREWLNFLYGDDGWITRNQQRFQAEHEGVMEWFRNITGQEPTPPATQPQAPPPPPQGAPGGPAAEIMGQPPLAPAETIVAPLVEPSAEPRWTAVPPAEETPLPAGGRRVIEDTGQVWDYTPSPGRKIVNLAVDEFKIENPAPRHIQNIIQSTVYGGSPDLTLDTITPEQARKIFAKRDEIKGWQKKQPKVVEYEAPPPDDMALAAWIESGAKPEQAPVYRTPLEEAYYKNPNWKEAGFPAEVVEIINGEMQGMHAHVSGAQKGGLIFKDGKWAGSYKGDYPEWYAGAGTYYKGIRGAKAAILAALSDLVAGTDDNKISMIQKLKYYALEMAALHSQAVRDALGIAYPYDKWTWELNRIVRQLNDPLVSMLPDAIEEIIGGDIIRLGAELPTDAPQEYIDRVTQLQDMAAAKLAWAQEHPEALDEMVNQYRRDIGQEPIGAEEQPALEILSEQPTPEQMAPEMPPPPPGAIDVTNYTPEQLQRIRQIMERESILSRVAKAKRMTEGPSLLAAGDQRQMLRDIATSIFGYTDEQAGDYMTLMDARADLFAKDTGLTRDDYYRMTFLGGTLEGDGTFTQRANVNMDMVHRARLFTGVTDDLLKAGFIDPEGQLLDLSAGGTRRSTAHGWVADKVLGDDAVHYSRGGTDYHGTLEKFMFDTQSTRVAYTWIIPERRHLDLQLDVVSRLTPAQIGAVVDYAARKGIATFKVDYEVRSTGEWGVMRSLDEIGQLEDTLKKIGSKKPDTRYDVHQNAFYQMAPGEPGPIWYHVIEKVVEKWPNERGSADSLGAWVRKQTRGEEIKWSGFDEWLDARKGQKVTKGEALDYLRIEGQVRFGMPLMYNLGETQDITLGTSYPTYTLPGGVSYREMVFAFPPDNRFEARYRQRHFTQFENVFAHVRFDDRTDADGKQVLFIEEVQSDWHQAGREKGYAPDIPAEIVEITKDNATDLKYATENEATIAYGLYGIGWPQDKVFYGVVDPASGRITSIHNTRDAALTRPDLVPAAPFAETWPMIVMQRMLRWASENDYDRVAWTTGDQQSERYNLSTQVQHIAWETNDDGTYNISAPLPDGAPGLYHEDLTLPKVREIVGADVARRIESGEGRPDKTSPYRDWHILEGEELTVGSEGMREFYDRQLVNSMNKYAKKWGAQVGETQIRMPAHREARSLSEARAIAGVPETVSVHSVDVTPEMRQSVMAGQPMLFQGAQPRAAVTFTTEGKAILTAFKGKNVTSLVHETGHVFLEDLLRTSMLATNPARRLQMASDIETTARWAGLENGTDFARLKPIFEEYTELRASGRDPSRMKAIEADALLYEQAHESFATAFERYLYDGKAPLEGLRRVFENFKRWLMSIYAYVKGTPIERDLDEGIRNVFDRLFDVEAGRTPDEVVTPGPDVSLPPRRAPAPGEQADMFGPTPVPMERQPGQESVFRPQVQPTALPGMGEAMAPPPMAGALEGGGVAGAGPLFGEQGRYGVMDARPNQALYNTLRSQLDKVTPGRAASPRLDYGYIDQLYNLADPSGSNARARSLLSSIREGELRYVHGRDSVGKIRSKEYLRILKENIRTYLRDLFALSEAEVRKAPAAVPTPTVLRSGVSFTLDGREYQITDIRRTLFGEIEVTAADLTGAYPISRVIPVEYLHRKGFEIEEPPALQPAAVPPEAAVSTTPPEVRVLNIGDSFEQGGQVRDVVAFLPNGGVVAVNRGNQVRVPFRSDQLRDLGYVSWEDQQRLTTPPPAATPPGITPLKPIHAGDTYNFGAGDYVIDQIDWDTGRVYYRPAGGGARKTTSVDSLVREGYNPQPGPAEVPAPTAVPDVPARAAREEQLFASLIGYFRKPSGAAGFFTQQEFESFIRRFDFDMDNELDVNLAYDLMEGALNAIARERRAELAARGITNLYDRLIAMGSLENQLTTSRRTLAKMKLQQFSTPLPLAEAAGDAADIRSGDILGESTAGTANLVDRFSERSDITLRVNEIDENRQKVLRLLGYDPTGVDVMSGAWVVDPITHKLLGPYANVQIINPPWGAYTTGKYGRAINEPVAMNDWSQRFTHLITQRTAEGGRIVSVQPTNWVYTMDRSTRVTTPNESAYLTWLKRTYAVRAIIESPPGAYRSRGTDVSSLIVVFDKVAPDPAAKIVEAWGDNQPADWQEYADWIDRIPNRTEGDIRRGQKAVNPIQVTGPEDTGLVDPAATRGEPRGDPSEIGKPAGGDVRGPIERVGPDRPGVEPPPVSEDRIPQAEDGDVIQPVRAGRGASPRLVERGTTTVRTGGLEPGYTPEFRARIARSRAAIVDTGSFAEYVARSPLGEGDTRQTHPNLIVETKALAGVPYPDLQEQARPTPGVFRALARRAISVEGNLDPVWAAVQQNDVYGRGILIADDVGIGKSRTAAAFALDRIERGKKKILVITADQGNVRNLMKKEFPSVWTSFADENGSYTTEPSPVLPARMVHVSGRTMPDVKKGNAVIPTFDDATVYFLSASEIADFTSQITDLAPDSVIVDEVHTFKNIEANKGAAWYNLHSDWLSREADIMYLSATPGADIADLEYLYGLRLWTRDGFSDWINIVTGRESPEKVQARLDAMGRIQEVAGRIDMAFRSAKARYPVRFVDVEPRYSKHGASQIGETIVYVNLNDRYVVAVPQDNNRWLMAVGYDSPNGYSGVMTFTRYDKAVVAAAIANDLSQETGIPLEKLDVAVIAERLAEVYPEASRADLTDAGIQEATDVRRPDSDEKKKGWGPKKTAFESTLAPAHTEQIMREMKAAGAYISRDISRTGVEFSLAGRRPSPQAISGFNERITIYRRIFEAFEKYGKMNEGEKRGGKFGVTGDIQGDAKRALFDMRLPQVMDLADQAIRNGEKVVISLISVGEVDTTQDVGYLNNALHKINTNEVHKTGGHGQPISYSAPTEIPEALIEIAEIREDMQRLGILRTPVDILTERYGDRVSFIIGEVPDKVREQGMWSFQHDLIDVIVISDAGKQGINLHDITGTRRVHMIVADYDWSATMFKQELGRVDRTGQRSSPRVTVTHNEAASERKFISTISNRMAGVGAVSKGAAASVGADAMVAVFELGSEIDKIALTQTWNALSYDLKMLFLEKVFKDSYGTAPVQRLDATAQMIHRFFKALQAIPFDEANTILETFIQEKTTLLSGPAAAQDERRLASFFKGTIKRDTRLNDQLFLTEVTNDAHEKFGIVTGIVSPYLNKILESMYGTAVQGGAWTQFTDTVTGERLSGLHVPFGRIKQVGALFDLELGAVHTVASALSDLMSGDRIPIIGPNMRTYELYMGTAGSRVGKIIIEGASMRDRDVLMRNNVKYHQNGFWYVEQDKLPDFFARFPINQVRPDAPGAQHLQRTWVPTENGPRRTLYQSANGSEVVQTPDGTPQAHPPEQVEPPPAAAAPLGTVQGLDPHPPIGETEAEAWLTDLRPVLGELEKRMTGPDAQIPRGKGDLNSISPTDMRELRTWLGQVEGNRADAKLASVRIGEAKRDSALLNYGHRYGFDNVLQAIWPYSFWYTRTALNWVFRAIDRPIWLANYARIREFQRDVQRTPGFPQRLAGKIRIPIPFLPGWMGGGIYVDPMRQLFPFEQILKPLEQLQQQTNQETQRAISILQQQAEDGEISQAGAAEAITTRKGKAWDAAQAQASLEIEGDISSAWDFASLIAGPSLPIQWALNIASVKIPGLVSGSPKKITRLPVTRGFESLTALAGLNEGRGYNLEGPLRRALSSTGIPEKDRFTDYNVERELANMVIEGLLPLEASQQAMMDHAGDAWLQAQQRVAKAGIVKYVGAPLGTDLFPEGEQEARALQGEYNRARDAWLGGDTQALNAFFDRYPEYEARLTLFRSDPNERLRRYLIGSIWDGYMTLPDLRRRELAEQAPEFEQSFLSKETRNYDNIDTATLTQWAQALGVKTPETAPEVPALTLEGAPEEVVRSYQAYQDEKDKRFPNLDDIMGRTYGVEEGRLQDAYKQRYAPVLDRYYSWKDKQLAAHPELIEYLQSDDSRLSFAPPEIQALYYQFQAQRDQIFPDIYDVQDLYFNLPEGRQRKVFREQHPELVNYWTWRREFLAQFPGLIPYVVSEDALAAAYLGDSYTSPTIDLSKYPTALTSTMMGYMLAGQPLGSGARKLLRQEWTSQGQPRGNFDAWLSSFTP